MGFGDRAAAQTTEIQTVYATHDFTSTAGFVPIIEANDRWVDTKTPGGGSGGPRQGRTYSVGTTNVRTTEDINNPTFSNAPVDFTPNYQRFPGGFTVAAANSNRQIVILQITEPDGLIFRQGFWYGDSPNVPSWNRRAATARAISVWEADDPAQTRIAICGETYDVVLEKNQFPDGPTDGWLRIDQDVGRGQPNGYVAVFDGFLELKWSYQFFFADFDGECGITDVSIRVVDTPQGLRDVVTYCGISSFGVPTTATIEPLTPRGAFAAPSTTVPGYDPAHGAVNNGPDQWDGIVGRLSNIHTSPNPLFTLHEAHAVVGGREQDGLFGLVELRSETRNELEKDRFVVVGSTATLSPSGAGPKTFPFTNSTENWNGEDYCVGTASIFEFAAGTLDLWASTPIGRRAFLPWGTTPTSPLPPGAWPDPHTIALDVAVQLDAVIDGNSVRQERIVIAGTTDDKDLLLFPNTQPIAPTTPYGDPSNSHTRFADGFVVVALDVPIFSDVFAISGTYSGVQGQDGWCGVSTWNEHLDHFAIVGRVLPSTPQLTMSSFFVDTASGAGPNGSQAVRLLRRDTVAVGFTNPASLGLVNATNASITPSGGMQFDTFGMWDTEMSGGGGVCIGPDGRVTVVGHVGVLTSYPVVGATARIRLTHEDGLRTELDMLPDGVCRTDGTGFDTTGLPLSIVSTADGGTTPAACRGLFGRRVGEPITGFAPRMLIDYEGPAPAPKVNASVLIDRPPFDTTIVGAFFQYGFPSASPMTPFSGPNPFPGVELWGDPTLASILLPTSGSRSERFQIATMPATTGHRWTVQVVCMLSSPMTCGTSSFGFVGSPALAFFY